MSNIKDCLNKLMDLDGVTCVALVDYTSGMLLGEAGSGLDIEIAAAGNTEVVRAKMKTAKALGLEDAIEDILITLSTAYHIIRPVSHEEGLFFYVVADSSKANLAMARRQVLNVEKSLKI